MQCTDFFHKSKINKIFSGYNLILYACLAYFLINPIFCTWETIPTSVQRFKPVFKAEI
jgi:hypothetical protein